MNKIEAQVFGKAQSWVSDCESYYERELIRRIFMAVDNERIHLLGHRKPDLSVYQLTALDSDIGSHAQDFIEAFYRISKDVLLELSSGFSAIIAVDFQSDHWSGQKYVSLEGETGYYLSNRGLISSDTGTNREVAEIFFSHKEKDDPNDFLCCCALPKEVHSSIKVGEITSIKQFEKVKCQIQRVASIVRFTTSDAWHLELTIEIDHSEIPYSDFVSRLQFICSRHQKRLEI